MTKRKKRISALQKENFAGLRAHRKRAKHHLKSGVLVSSPNLYLPWSLPTSTRTSSDPNLLSPPKTRIKIATGYKPD